MLLYVAYIGLGILLLYLGGELLVKHAVSLARRWGISSLVVGLTVVAFGTSSPELAASVVAALQGSAGIALGNVVGSNIFNIMGILGLAALLSPIIIQSQFIRREVPVMIAVTLALPLCLYLGSGLGRLEGIGLLIVLVAYLFFLYRSTQQENPARSDTLPQLSQTAPYWHSYLGLAVGLVLLVAGAQVLLLGATQLAAAAGLSELVIGLTVVAFGTSLPELATSVVAALKREPDIAVGNIVGSNIFNILGILGVTSLLSPIDVQWSFVQRDVWVMVAVSGLLWILMRSGRRLSRLEAVAMLVLYGGYLFWIL